MIQPGQLHRKHEIEFQNQLHGDINFLACHHSTEEAKASEDIGGPFKEGEVEIRVSGDLDFNFPLSELTVNRSVVAFPFILVDIFIPTPICRITLPVTSAP